jgi:8-oxo-dGTP pyrophosphatase MutT (NUDIX family)
MPVKPCAKPRAGKVAGGSTRRRAVRPRPAASIMTVWHDPSGLPHIFMGRRDASLRFMPGYLVFPGGRVEPSDKHISEKDHLARACGQTLQAELGGAALPQSYARAALRECVEETGLDLAQHLEGNLTYIARAITPPHLSMRYDTRFFLATVAPSAQPPLPQTQGDGELLQPDWFSLHDLASEPLHHVTQAVLKHGLQGVLATHPRLLVADRMPKRWKGSAPLRSRDIKATQSASRTPSRS